MQFKLKVNCQLDNNFKRFRSRRWGNGVFFRISKSSRHIHGESKQTSRASRGINASTAASILPTEIATTGIDNNIIIVWHIFSSLRYRLFSYHSRLLHAFTHTPLHSIYWSPTTLIRHLSLPKNIHQLQSRSVSLIVCA